MKLKQSFPGIMESYFIIKYISCSCITETTLCYSALWRKTTVKNFLPHTRAHTHMYFTESYTFLIRYFI